MFLKPKNFLIFQPDISSLKFQKLIETYRGTVFPWQCDFFDHMNVQFFVAKFDEATWQFWAHIGFTAAFFKSEKRSVVAMEQHIRYYRSCFAGDLIMVKSELLEVRRKSIRFRHKMYNVLTDELVAEVEYVSVHIYTPTRQSCEFTPEIKARLLLKMKDQKDS